MPITIRPYEPGDRDAVFAALAMIYGDGTPAAQDQELPANRLHFVAMDGLKCCGLFGELSFNSLRAGGELATGGLAMVGVVPERRHTGVGSELMRFALREMHAQGKQLASLYAFSEAYYRQFGYEICGSRLKFACQTRLLPKVRTELPVRRLPPSEVALVRPCYRAFAAARSGLADRDDYLWERVLGRRGTEDDPQFEKTVYAVGDPIEGYLVLKHAVEFHVEQQILELAWSSPDGYEALLTLMRSVSVNKSGLSWFEPSDSPMYYRYLVSAPLSEVRLEKPTMYRVINVPEALRRLRPSEDAEFTIRVSDPDLTENDGPWRVVARDGKVDVTRADSAELEFDIRAFTQVFLGEPGIDDVLRNGFGRASSPKAVDAFRRILPPTPVFCLDMF